MVVRPNLKGVRLAMARLSAAELGIRSRDAALITGVVVKIGTLSPTIDEAQLDRILEAVERHRIILRATRSGLVDTSAIIGGSAS